MIEIDCRGLKCPLPVLRLEKALDGAASGALLRVLVTDPVARIDIPLHCRQNGHACAIAEDGEMLAFSIVVGGAA